MELFNILFVFFFISVQLQTSQAVVDCNLIAVCANFQSTRVKRTDQYPDLSNWENETEIAKRGSWQGIVPDSYNLQLNFVNRSHYTGAVAISFSIQSPTSPTRIMINHGEHNPITVDYTGITITPLCGKSSFYDIQLPSRRNRATAPTTRCIQKAIFLEANETLILELNAVTFEIGPDIWYYILFPYFQGKAGISAAKNPGSTGLVEAANESPYIGYYSATTTIFQMRYARTVFPSFDHPSLKAKFFVCIERPADILVVSNTMTLGNRSANIGSDWKRDCFEPTPKIPTYVFSFALMENYTSESIKMSNDGPIVEVFAPITKIDKVRWMLNESVPVIQYLENITKFKFPLKRLAFVVAYPAPFWGVENFGLVTVDGGFLQAPESTDTAYTILYHEIVHQWLGDVFTISEWREICLQEGLTAYFEWKISMDRRRPNTITLDMKAQSVKNGKEGQTYYEPYALLEYKITQDIADHCYGRPSFFFHTVTKRFGFEAMERLMAKLIEKKPYGSVNLDLWDSTLDEVTSEGNRHMKGYLQDWFLQPGPLYLLVSKAAQSDCIVIRQQVYKGSEEQPTVPRLLPMDVHVYTSGSSTPRVLNLLSRTAEERVCNVPSPFLVDPDSNTLTNKVYTAQIYRDIFEIGQKNTSGVTDSQMKNVLHDFCKAFLRDILPLANEPSTTKPSDWLQVYEMVKNATPAPVTGPGPIRVSACRCCLNSKEENEKFQQCKFMWNGSCRGLRLNSVVGYNYTMDRESGPVIGKPRD